MLTQIEENTLTLAEAAKMFLYELRSIHGDDWFFKSRKAMLDEFVRWCEAKETGFADTWKFHLGTVKPHNYADGDYVAVCPCCGSEKRQIKVGRTAAGSQRYKCKECGYKYTPKSTACRS